MSAYMLWLGEVREQIKQENPGISVTELSKVAGEKWKQIEDKSVSWRAKFRLCGFTERFEDRLLRRSHPVAIYVFWGREHAILYRVD